MSDFDSAWSSAAALMDAAVDSHLGDRIRYKRAGDQDFAVIEGFVLVETAPIDMDHIDEPVSTVPRVKVAKSTIPLPAMTDRIQHPQLGPGTYRPLGTEPVTQGRYWIFDVQKVAS